MAMWDNVATQGRRLVADLRVSVARARLEGERRLLQRQHRAAAERLGQRTWELVRAGRLDPAPLREEIGEVDRVLDEIAAAVAEIEGLAHDDAPADGDPAT